MKCPHCGIGFDPEPSSLSIDAGEDVEASFALETTRCTECKRLVATLLVLRQVEGAVVLRQSGGMLPAWSEDRHLVWPPARGRSCPGAVPSYVAQQYKEAALVLPLSPRASAALSQRCLQAILEDEAKVKQAPLHAEIQEAMDRGDLPSYVTDVLHGVRQFGNLGAHQKRLTCTGEIIDVETGEAEWMLGALEAVFDHYYVKPAETKKVLEGLEMKRKGGDLRRVRNGPPPMKTPSQVLAYSSQERLRAYTSGYGVAGNTCQPSVIG